MAIFGLCHHLFIQSAKCRLLRPLSSSSAFFPWHREKNIHLACKCFLNCKLIFLPINTAGWTEARKFEETSSESVHQKKKLFYGSSECVCHKWFSRVRLNYKSWPKLQRIGVACFKDTLKRRNVSDVDTDIVLVMALRYLLSYIETRMTAGGEGEKKGPELTVSLITLS